jgi:hypothetical protein
MWPFLLTVRGKKHLVLEFQWVIWLCYTISQDLLRLNAYKNATFGTSTENHSKLELERLS